MMGQLQLFEMSKPRHGTLQTNKIGFFVQEHLLTQLKALYYMIFQLIVKN
jgi:hypothetical protein